MKCIASTEVISTLLKFIKYIITLFITLKICRISVFSMSKLSKSKDQTCLGAKVYYNNIASSLLREK